jgi:hypothetical protein
MRHWSVRMGEYSTGGAVVRPVIKQGTDGATLLLGADEALLRGTETILFVEDQNFVREVTVKILKSAGYRVLVAKSAAEASRAYELVWGRGRTASDRRYSATRKWAGIGAGTPTTESSASSSSYHGVCRTDGEE